MATLEEMRNYPGDYLGSSNNPEADQESYALFFEAVDCLLEQDDTMDEEQAADRVFGNGDFVCNALRILGRDPNQSTESDLESAHRARGDND